MRRHQILCDRCGNDVDPKQVGVYTIRSQPQGLECEEPFFRFDFCEGCYARMRVPFQEFLTTMGASVVIPTPPTANAPRDPGRPSL